MARKFVGGERGQLLLMPPSLTDWLPEGHLVWTVLGAVDQMDLDRFFEGYRLEGAGRPAYDPAMMVALLLYAYARGNRSSRGIERACLEDVAYKVITTMRTPDHSTIAEFRRRHESEIGELFEDVLGLCREAGLVQVGVVTIDGTKIKANASMDNNHSYREIVTAILREADAIDRAEDELYGDARGDELPEQLRTPEGRKAALGEAKRRIQERKGRAAAGDVGETDPSRVEVDPERTVTRQGGRREWSREARRELERHRERERRAIPRDRDDRLFESVRRLEQNHQVELEANQAYERWRQIARDTTGRRLGGPIKPYQPPALPDGTINTSDPDSRVMRTQGTPPVQGYNAQTAVNARQIILAADVTVDAPDFAHLEPMLDATLRELQQQGVTELPEAVIADAGYWHTAQMQSISERGIEVLVPPDGNLREGKRPGWENGLYALMRQRLSTERGKAALPAAQDNRRAGLRADQTQPPDRPVPTKRQSRRPLGVAPSGSNPQSPQAAQPLDRQPRLTRRQSTPTAVRFRGTTPQLGLSLFPNSSTASRHSARPDLAVRAPQRAAGIAQDEQARSPSTGRFHLRGTGRSAARVRDEERTLHLCQNLRTF